MYVTSASVYRYAQLSNSTAIRLISQDTVEEESNFPRQLIQNKHTITTY